MPPDTSPIAGASLGDRLKLLSTRTRLLTLGNLDKRTRAYRETVAIIDALTSDIGGDPSTAQKQLIARAALTCALISDLETRWLAGEMLDPGIHATLSNSLRRLLQTIGLERSARDVSQSLEQIASDIDADTGAAA